MPVIKLTADEIKLLRKTLKMSEAEFAERIELEDRQVVKLLESGAAKPTLPMYKLLMKLLSQGASASSPKLKKMLDEVKERSKAKW